MKILEPDVPVKVKSSTSLRFELMPKFGPIPWLDNKNSQDLVEAKFHSKEINEQQKLIAQKWITDGYSILPKLFSDEQIDNTLIEYENLITEGEIETEPEKYGFPGRYLNPNLHSFLIREMMSD